MHTDATEPAVTATEGDRRTSSEAAPFRTSVMLWTVGTDVPFDQRLEWIADAGYRSAELVGEYAGWSERDFHRHNDKRRDLGIGFDCTASAMVAPGRSRHNAADPRQREDFLADVRAELRAMEKIDCPEMVVLGGDAVPGLDRRAQRASCVETLKRAAELAESAGVTILLGNVDAEENRDYLARSVVDAFKIVAEVGHPHVKLRYDFSHAQISGGNLIANLERHLDLVGKVHIGDVPGHHEADTGEIKFTNIYSKLAEVGYDGYVAMELVPTGDPVRTLARAREATLLADKLQAGEKRADA